MADLKAIPKKMSNTKLKLSDLNPHLMCVLCGGYYIDATTIVECLHSFCRSCIVKHLESSKYCPICEVQVHKTKPLINIRADKTLQDIVYKLVPGLFANEMRNRRRFYRERPHYIKPNDSESSGEVSGERKIYINDENITFSLVYHEGPGPTNTEEFCREFPPPAHNERRYFKCPTGVTVQHLKKLLRAKYELSESNYKLEIYFRDQELHEDLTLLDISYLYLWKTKGTLDLTYKIFENVAKRQKIDQKPDKAPIETPQHVKVSIPQPETTKGDEDRKKTEEANRKPQPEPVTAQQPELPKEPAKENGEVKEVQLQISESGVMSVSQVEDSQIVRTVEETATKVTKTEPITGPPAPAKELKPGNGDVVKRAEKPPGKPNKPYKTIRCSPKTWHPVIPKEKLRPTLINNSDEPRKPLKFFKMRNMPRFLGNPSTGVKPLFAEAPNNPQEKKPDPAKTVNKILKIDPKTLRPIEKEDLTITSTPSAPNLLTNPFIPNNNHFLFSDLHLLPPNAGSFKENPSLSPGFKAPLPNGSFPPICFPTPEHSPPGFYPFPALSKPQSFPFPDKMDPLLRASRLSPFGNLTGFNMAGFHASLPPSISRLLNPHHHFRKISQTLEQKKSKEESTKETTKRCDDSFKVNKGEEVAGTGGSGEKKEEKKVEREKKKKEEEEKEEKEREKKEERKEKEEEKGGEREKEEVKGVAEERKEVNGEAEAESASEVKGEKSGKEKEKERKEEEDKEKEREIKREISERVNK